MEIPRWIGEIILLIIFLWVVDREIEKLKKWIEELVGFKRQQSGSPLSGLCSACGKPKAEDYADCPICHRRFVDPGICGTEWTKSAERRFNTE